MEFSYLTPTETHIMLKYIFFIHTPVQRGCSTDIDHSQDALHLKFTYFWCRNAVGDVKVEKQALQLTAMQMQWSMNKA